MESITLAWWIWMVGGIVLMAMELLLPTGFFLFFFGVGGIATGLLTLAGLSRLEFQGIVFIAVSLLCIVLLRKPLLTKFHFRNRTHSVDSLVGETARTLEAIAPQRTGRVEMRGSTWSAFNTGPEPIGVDVCCRVDRVVGLTLYIKL